MRKSIFVSLALILSHFLHAQQTLTATVTGTSTATVRDTIRPNITIPVSLGISGTVRDQIAKTPLQRATVRLYGTTDSTFSRSTLTDSAGRFTFNNLPKDSFVLDISYGGYKQITRPVKLDNESVNLDIAAVQSSSSELATVVITANIAPVTQKGDTLQVNASQFKVNPDASAEDMMKKVPGITIENGQVKAQGEVVQKVTLDGRELFGDDATAALRNLPAEVIDKIQIFDRLSDQAQFTGFDDGNSTKGINIVTKANMRNGQFGRVFAGYGTDDRYAAGGNATIFHENRRLSIVGNFNNVNQQNFSQQDLLGVTSAGGNQRGGPGGGGRGNAGGGGGNRGQGGQGGGGNFGQFGGNGNFLVGTQSGINKTNAFGINFSDLWGKKLTVTGSYFFNQTNNLTNQTANTQYFSGTLSNSFDTTASNSRNTNHRVNLRLEWKIDSANSIIFTPNLSFQSNQTDRQTGSLQLFNPGYGYTKRITENNSSSTRSGDNLNNTILFRHSFKKRGRTFSANLNTSYNERKGQTYVTTFQRSFTDTSMTDIASQRFTDQPNSGLQVSTNINYTEPISTKSQLQLTYNPTFSKSKSDQHAFGLDPSTHIYSLPLDSLSNVFENRTSAQNGGVTYRWGDRERQIAFGVNYQSTNLKSDQTFPHELNVNKTFSNFLPNAMIRYKLSAKSSIRLFYRANVNNPSVTQLQNVVDPTNAPYYTAGNPELVPQYMNTVSGQYTFTNTAKGLLLVGNIFYQAANHYISNATFTPTKDTLVNGQTLKVGDQLTKPVNLDGYENLRSFLTFAVPLKFIKTNFNLNGGVTYSKIPGIINNVQNMTNNLTYSAGVVLASNISQYVDFTISYTGNYNNVTNDVFPSRNDNYYQSAASIQLNLLTKTGWFLQNDFNNQFYSGLAEGYNQSYYLWNMSAGKKFLKDQKGELKLSVFDLLKQNQSITRNTTSDYIQDVQNQVLQQYLLLTFTYNLRNFGTPASRQQNRNNGNFNRSFNNGNGGRPNF